MGCCSSNVRKIKNSEVVYEERTIQQFEQSLTFSQRKVEDLLKDIMAISCSIDHANIVNICETLKIAQNSQTWTFLEKIAKQRQISFQTLRNLSILLSKANNSEKFSLIVSADKHQCLNNISDIINTAIDLIPNNLPAQEPAILAYSNSLKIAAKRYLEELSHFSLAVISERLRIMEIDSGEIRMNLYAEIKMEMNERNREDKEYNDEDVGVVKANPESFEKIKEVMKGNEEEKEKEAVDTKIPDGDLSLSQFKDDSLLKNEDSNDNEVEELGKEIDLTEKEREIEGEDLDKSQNDDKSEGKVGNQEEVRNLYAKNNGIIAEVEDVVLNNEEVSPDCEKIEEISLNSPNPLIDSESLKKSEDSLDISPEESPLEIPEEIPEENPEEANKSENLFKTIDEPSSETIKIEEKSLGIFLESETIKESESHDHSKIVANPQERRNSKIPLIDHVSEEEKLLRSNSLKKSLPAEETKLHHSETLKSPTSIAESRIKMKRAMAKADAFVKKQKPEDSGKESRISHSKK